MFGKRHFERCYVRIASAGWGEVDDRDYRYMDSYM